MPNKHIYCIHRVYVRVKFMIILMHTADCTEKLKTVILKLKRELNTSFFLTGKREHNKEISEAKFVNINTFQSQVHVELKLKGVKQSMI